MKTYFVACQEPLVIALRCSTPVVLEHARNATELVRSRTSSHYKTGGIPTCEDERKQGSKKHDEAVGSRSLAAFIYVSFFVLSSTQAAVLQSRTL